MTMTMIFFRQRVKRLEDEGHDPSDWKAACEKGLEWGDTIYTGLFFQKMGAPTLEQLEPVLEKGGALANRPVALTWDQSKNVLKRMI